MNKENLIKYLEKELEFELEASKNAQDGIIFSYHKGQADALESLKRRVEHDLFE